jgi:hypothetical protein
MDAKHPDSSAANLFLKKYAHELALLASGLDELQHTVGQLASLTSDTDLTVRAQAADELAQHARALADVAGKLAAEDQFDSNSIERALKSVNLTGLATRLAGARAAALQTGGEFELF